MGEPFRGSLGREPSDLHIQWDPPKEGWKVLNTDGVAKGHPGPAGAGGVIRGDQGEWIVGFLEHLGRCSAVKAEVKVVL